MKVKDGFVLKKICGENVIVATGIKNIDFNSIISINESAAVLFRTISQMSCFTVDDMVEALRDEYEVDEDRARKGSEAMLAEWTSNGIIDN